LSLVCVIAAAGRGELAARLLPPLPSVWDFVAGVGQALFLFMGFELLTSQAEIADDPRSVRRALGGSVVLLGAFYATVSLGFSCLTVTPEGDVAPQLAIAEQSGGVLAALLVTALSLLASFTSFNGALLTLSRLTAALAAQGVLPRSLSRVEPRSLAARPALALLLMLALVALVLVNFADMLRPSILAAAIAAALVYAGLAWVRQFAPFAEPQRAAIWRAFGVALAAGLVALAVGVLLDAGAALAGTLALLVAAVATGAFAAWRLRPLARHGGTVHAR
jgi:APA family basic amino acid/polyamine antiporter